MPVLELVLAHTWYDKIARGEKKYEYRETKPYWTKRLFSQAFDTVRFRRGYSHTTMYFELICIGETTAPNDLNLPRCYRLTLGRRINEQSR